jgi:hypothetical protein
MKVSERGADFGGSRVKESGSVGGAARCTTGQIMRGSSVYTGVSKQTTQVEDGDRKQEQKKARSARRPRSGLNIKESKYETETWE